MLLRDQDIIPLLAGTTPLIKYLKLPNDPYQKDSPIQPASIDISIGKIFVPGKTKDELGGENRHLTTHAVRPGETAVVETLEEFALPLDVAGVGFPPSHVSSLGLLMTNPGHIDPGFKGRLRFTVINMSKVDYCLTKGQPIVTVLLYKLSGPAHRGWLDAEIKPSFQDMLDQLSRDFLAVEERAERIAKRTVEKTGLWLQIGVPIMVALITAFVTLWAKPWQAPIDRLKEEVITMKSTLNLTEIKGETTDLKNELDQLKRTVTSLERRVPKK